MTLYTNNESLFGERLDKDDNVIEKFYKGQPFYKIMTEEAWQAWIKDQPHAYYHDFSDQAPRYKLLKTEDVQEETHLVTVTPAFLLGMFETETFFPTFFPDSPHFKNPIQNFFGLFLRDVYAEETILHPPKGVWEPHYQVPLPLEKRVILFRELLVGSEKVVVEDRDLKLASGKRKP